MDNKRARAMIALKTYVRFTHPALPSLSVELQPRTRHTRYPVRHAARPNVKVTLPQQHQQAFAGGGIQQASGPGGNARCRYRIIGSRRGG